MITPVNKPQGSVGIIKSIKKALKEADKNPFLYTNEEVRTLKRKNVSGKTSNVEQTSKNAMGSVSTYRLDNVDIEYNNTFDCVQENEDDWISSCLGSEYDVVNSLY